FGPLLWRHHMDRLAAHHPYQIFLSMHDYSLGGQGLWIETSEGMKSEKTSLIDMSDDKAYLVHMGCHHHALSIGISVSSFDSYYVTEIVGCDLICEWCHQVNYQVSNSFFKARCSGYFTDLLQQGYVYFHCFWEFYF